MLSQLIILSLDSTVNINKRVKRIIKSCGDTALNLEAISSEYFLDEALSKMYSPDTRQRYCSIEAVSLARVFLGVNSVHINNMY